MFDVREFIEDDDDWHLERIPFEGSKVAQSRGLCGACGEIIQLQHPFWWSDDLPPTPLCYGCHVSR